MTARLWILTVSLLVGLVWGVVMVSTAYPARSHEWYDEDCCSGKDCGVVQGGGGAEWTPNGWIVRSGTWILNVDGKRIVASQDRIIPEGRVRPSPDGRTHVCISGWGFPLCVYVGGGS